MFHHLDDPTTFVPDQAFRAQVDIRQRQLHHRRTTGRAVLGGCLVIAATAGYLRSRLDLNHDLVVRTLDDSASVSGPPDSAAGTGLTATTEAPTSSSAPGTMPDQAINVLLVASDSRQCIDPNSPYAGAFGTGIAVAGERSDTIMLLRLDPADRSISMLSFPRDLWVTVAGRTGKSRINAAFDRTNPQKLISTIVENFSVPIDHYVQVDFCGFKDLVDAVGGVRIPFEFGARDNNTGFYVAAPECHEFHGDEALAYVRSRHYEWLDPASGQWRTDGSSDFGRITRQQDFVARLLDKASATAGTDPVVAKRLIDIAMGDVVTDSDLTIGTLLGWFETLGHGRLGDVRHFQIEADGRTINGNAVLIPRLNDPWMVEVLRLFRSESSMSPSEATGPSKPSEPDTTGSSVPGPILPPDDPSCP